MACFSPSGGFPFGGLSLREGVRWVSSWWGRALLVSRFVVRKRAFRPLLCSLLMAGFRCSEVTVEVEVG